MRYRLKVLPTTLRMQPIAEWRAAHQGLQLQDQACIQTQSRERAEGSENSGYPAPPRFRRPNNPGSPFLCYENRAFSLVDNNRTWYGAKYSLNICESPRTNAFCDHAILGTDVFVVMDARRPARFADNATVAGPPHLRFYAGAPLIIDDAAIGTLCLLDAEPRQQFDGAGTRAS